MRKHIEDCYHADCDEDDNNLHGCFENCECVPSHTPTPWTLRVDDYSVEIVFLQPKIMGGARPNLEIATVHDDKDFQSEVNAKANAAFIVRAVNSHIALLNILGMAEATIKRLDPDSSSSKGTLDCIRHAITKAEGNL